jgi:hypothetical protein
MLALMVQFPVNRKANRIVVTVATMRQEIAFKILLTRFSIVHSPLFNSKLRVYFMFSGT